MKVIILVIIALTALVLYKQFAGGKSAKGNIEMGVEFLTNNQSIEGVQVFPSGLQYQVLNAATGNVHPRPKDKVKVHYHGTLLDGTVFDSSVDRGEPWVKPGDQRLDGRLAIDGGRGESAFVYSQ
jgi:peptidylprolyl isomerase